MGVLIPREEQTHRINPQSVSLSIFNLNKFHVCLRVIVSANNFEICQLFVYLVSCHAIERFEAIVCLTT